jgi:hypothetical protein
MAKMDDEPFRRLAPSDSASDVALRQRFRTFGLAIANVLEVPACAESINRCQTGLDAKIQT